MEGKDFRMRGIFLSWGREDAGKEDKGRWQLLGNQVPEEVEYPRRWTLDHRGRGNSNQKCKTSQ